MSNDSKLIELSCKEFLMGVVKESTVLDEKLSFFQKTLLFDKIKEMDYNTVISLLFNDGKEITSEQKREFESKTKKVAKYGAAALVGRQAGLAKIGKASFPLITKGKPMSQRNIGKLGTKGGIRGALAGIGAMYLYRKLSDPCVRHNLGNKEAQLACKSAAANKVATQIKNNMAQCSNAANPEKCKQKLSKEAIRWQTKFQQNLVASNKQPRKQSK